MGVMIVLLMDHREVIIKDAMKVPVQVRSIDPSNLLFRDFLFIILNTYTSVHIVRPQFLKWFQISFGGFKKSTEVGATGMRGNRVLWHVEEATKLGPEIVIIQPRCTEGIAVPSTGQRTQRLNSAMRISAQVINEKFDSNGGMYLIYFTKYEIYMIPNYNFIISITKPCIFQFWNRNISKWSIRYWWKLPIRQRPI